MGLSVGLILAVAGLTGSILVFEDELEAYVFNRDMWRVETTGPHLSHGELLDHLQAKRAGDSFHGVGLPIVEGYANRGFFTRTVNGEEKDYFAAINPHTGDIQGEFVRHGLPITRQTLVSVIYEFHRSLFAGTVGLWVMGLTGLFSIFLVVFGTILWWPRGGKWAVALTYKARSSARRSHYDVHKLSGVYLGLAIATMSFTGIYLSLPEPFRAVVAAVSTIDEGPSPVVDVQQLPFIGGDAAQRVAEQHFPGARTMIIFAPSSADDSYTVTLRHEHYPRTSNGGSRAYVDPYSGKLLATVDSRAASPGTSFLSWMFPIHNAEITGMAGRIALVFLGMVPVTLMVTGFLLWRHRRAGLARKRVQMPAPGTA